MAIIYVDDGGSNTSPYETWAKAATTLQVALDAWSSGDVIYVHVGASGPHAETTAGNVTLSSTAADSKTALIDVYGVDQNNSDAAVSQPSAITIEVTGTGVIAITLNANWHGLYFSSAANDINVSTASTTNFFYDCRINAGAANPTSGDDLGAGDDTSTLGFYNCILTVGDQIINNAGSLVYKGCTITAGRASTVAVFLTILAKSTGVIVDSCDFSGVGAGYAFVGITGRLSNWTFTNCDMPTTWVGTSGTWLEYNNYVAFLNCDDSNDYPRSEIYSQAGDTKTDTGVYITTSGWSDETANSSGTPLSQKLTPSSVINLGATVDSMPIDEYLATTGSKTFTVELIDDFETALQDDEVWLEIFYHATSGQVGQSIGTSRVILGDTVANLSAGTGTGNWTGEPGSSRSVKLAVPVTTGNIGWYSAVVRLAKYEANGADTNPGAALYVAPLLTIS